MTTSGTFGFAPSTGEVILQAFRRIEISRAAVTAEQMLDARVELNLLGSEWSNVGPNLWAVDLQGPFALAQGQASLALDPATVDVLDLWLTIPGATDRTLVSMSRTDYAEQAKKVRQGQPASFWLDKTAPMSLTFWPVPDGNGPYTLSFFRSRQTQDATVPSGGSPDTPFRFLDALVWGLAERLAYIAAPDKVPLIGARAQRALADARAEDTEDAPTILAPMMGGYFR